jgi:twitching motility protein PilI
MRTRRDLVGFQRRLVERLDAAASRRIEHAHLALESAGEGWLVELADARELIPVPPLTDVPMAKPWFRGVAGVRGELVGVVDYAAYRGHEPTALRIESRVLIPHARFGINCALLFSRSLGLKDARSYERDAEDLIDDAGRRWHMLPTATLLSEARFLDIAA